MSAVIDNATEVADEVVFDASTKAEAGRNQKSEEAPAPTVQLTIMSDAQRTYQQMCSVAEKLAETIGILPAYDVKDPAQLAKAKADLALCRAVVSATERAYEQWYRPYQRAHKSNVENRDTLIAIGRAMGQHINEQIQAEARRKAAAKAERDRLEQERVAAHESAIADIAHGANVPSADSQTIADKIALYQSPEFLSAREWKEYSERAEIERDKALAALQTHLTNAQAREALAALQAKQAQEQAEREAADKAARQMAERLREIELAPRSCSGMGSAFIAGQIEALKKLDTASFGDRAADAEEAKALALRDMNDMHEAAQRAETQQAEHERQMAEQARMTRATADIQAISGKVTSAKRHADHLEIDDIKESLEEVRNWPMTEEHFGALLAAAQITQATTITQLEALIESTGAAIAAHAAERLAEQQRAQEQAARLAAERAAAERIKANAARVLASLKALVADAQGAGLQTQSVADALALIAELEQAA
jgi:hypothetical protein